jgi:hypothetical protein
VTIELQVVLGCTGVGIPGVPRISEACTVCLRLLRMRTLSMDERTRQCGAPRSGPACADVALPCAGVATCMLKCVNVHVCENIFDFSAPSRARRGMVSVPRPQCKD